MPNVVRALAAFQRTLISVRSPYDRYRHGGQVDALNASARRGEAIFFSGERAGCFQCHGGWNFNGAVAFEGGPRPQPPFLNTGLYNIAGNVSYPEPNTGLHRHTGHPEDVGRFRVPTLRNVAVTAPYMHDGSIATLDAVIEHYAAGGRAIYGGPHAGVGSDNPNKTPNVRGFILSPGEKRDLIAFLESLTDEEFLADPRFSDPWAAQADPFLAPSDTALRLGQ
jgi:cytochrome c peroxidase